MIPSVKEYCLATEEQLNLQRWLELSPCQYQGLLLPSPPQPHTSSRCPLLPLLSTCVFLSLFLCVSLLLPLPLSLPLLSLCLLFISLCLYVSVSVCFLLCISVVAFSISLALPFPPPPSPCTRIHFRGIAPAQQCACLYNLNKCINA